MESGDEVVAVGAKTVGLALSLKTDGDREVFMPPDIAAAVRSRA
jgi:hypothetical protein